MDLFWFFSGLTCVLRPLKGTPQSKPYWFQGQGVVVGGCRQGDALRSRIPDYTPGTKKNGKKQLKEKIYVFNIVYS